MLSLFSAYRYNVLKNVRVEKSTGKVFRKYVKIQKGKLSEPYWLLVDYKTTHPLKDARPCPPDCLKRLLQTAF